MGEVYLAWDTKHEREVALKFLPAKFTEAADIERFRQESYILFQFDHPNIVRIYEFVEDSDPQSLTVSGYQPSPDQDRVFFIVDEFIPGQNLREYMNQKAVGHIEGLRIAVDIAKAISHAHQKGMIHRDIKPENIMIDPQGQVKIIDFGLAKLMDWYVKDQLNSSYPKRVPFVKTGKGEGLGTLLYMSPEQWGQVPRDGGEDIDERTDVWSLGIVLYELLTNGYPFESHTMDALRLSILFYAPRKLPQRWIRGLKQMQRIILSALAKDRADRYQTIDDMLQDMEKLKAHLESKQNRPAITSLFRWRPWS